MHHQRVMKRALALFQLNRHGLESGPLFRCQYGQDRVHIVREVCAQAPIDHVMVTAGGPSYGPLLEMDSDEVREALSGHVVVALEVARGAAGKMIVRALPRVGSGLRDRRSARHEDGRQQQGDNPGHAARCASVASCMMVTRQWMRASSIG